MINPEKLHNELMEAGISISGCNSAGIVWDVDGKTQIQDRQDVKTIIDAHVPEDKWELVRNRRNQLLAECDWTQLQDAVFTEEQKLAWSEYRQKLRDLPQDFKEPELVVYPRKP